MSFVCSLPTRWLGALAACIALAAPAQASDHPWEISLRVEQGTPGGWVQVRENALPGTRLHIHDDLGVNHFRTLKIEARKPVSDVAQWRFGISSSALDGSTTLTAPVVFNGTIAAPGRLRTTTHFPDFFTLDAAYWRRLVQFGNGGRLWGSVGLTYVMLNFRLDGTIAANSPGHELKEDFYVQELPVPVLGLHLRYPLSERLQFTVDASAGRLPWVNSFRTEGGQVRLAQTNTRASLGLSYAFNAHWRASAYGFYSYFMQNERSREDGNEIRLSSRGIGLDVNYRF